MKVRAVLESSSGVSCVSSKLAEQLEAHFVGTRITYPIRKSAKARVADGRELPIQQQTRGVNVTILTPWAPVEVEFPLDILPGKDDVLIVGSREIRDLLGIDVMATLKENVAKGVPKTMSPDEVTKAAVASWESQLEKERISQVGQVKVTLEGMRSAAERRALPEARDDIREALIARGPAMFMDPDVEYEVRTEVLQRAVEAAMTAGMEPEVAGRLGRLVLGIRLDVFRRALTGEPAANVDPLRIQLKPDASMARVRARPRQVAPEKMDWLEKQMQQLVAADIVRFNRHVTCSSVAMAVPKGRGYRMAADYRAANAQVELVPWPMPDLAAMSA